MKLNGPIILIDDDEDDYDILNVICNKLGICDLLKHFDSGKEFLAYLRTTSDTPFIILCDINMPVMNGIDLRMELNSDERLRRKSIPFIFFSTAATPEQVQKAYDLTVQGFFIKGFTFQDMETKIRRILEYWIECKHPNSL